MSPEVTVPLLPCASIDDIIAFYEVLGFRTTYTQRRPNPYAALQRGQVNLHFFEMAGFDPADSYGSCLLVTPDTGALHRAFAEGMRAAYGKVLVQGTPRMTRPRARKNYDGLSGFSVIDPGGNWIRVVQQPAAETATPSDVDEADPGAANLAAAVPGAAGPAAAGPGADKTAGRLARSLADAVVQGDSRGDARQASRILDSALARAVPADDPVTYVEILVYRAELALVLDDPATAGEMLARAGQVALSPEESARAAQAFETAADLTAALP